MDCQPKTPINSRFEREATKKRRAIFAAVLRKNKELDGFGHAGAVIPPCRTKSVADA
jgi:hypothetical protein